jgi:signal transduction histidine kinase/CheY-like chemotaxis protein
MRTITSDRVARLDSILEGRRKQIGFRLGVGLCLIVFYQQLLGLQPTLWWAGLYAALQLVELVVFARGKALDRISSRAGYDFALAMIFANTLVFGSLAVLWPFKTGAWGVANGAFLIAGAMLNTVLTTQESKAVFRASALPLVIYCIILPVVALAVGCKPDLALGLAIGGGMLCASSLKLWNGAHKVYLAERSARADAERRRAEAESAVAAKSAFVAMVSHELRTPISAILAGATELERVSDGVGRAHARLISDAGAMMRTLLNDLLDLAKLDAGRMAVESLTYDFRALVADQLRFWRAEARNQGLALRLNGAASAPRWVQGDPTRLRQVLNNLLSNALKFTDDGSVTVGLGVSPMDDGRLSLTIDVADTGAGMTVEQVERLFRPFEQADNSIARTHGGTGLGLVISRQLARMMDGDITVTSTPGQGTCFRFNFAIAAAADAAGAHQPSPSMAEMSAVAAGKPIAVLVVDDHEINRRAISLMLEPLSADVALAASGGDALSLLAARPFDLVLMDVHMPDMSGKEATMRLRLAAGPNRRTPVIAVTGATAESDIQACLAAGMNDWVAKPIDAGQLYTALARQLEGEAEPEAA